ncbi:MAG TPA: antitoxin Xre/MbcA/ParS toxin-binding domain-containing protein [Stellaceae bacterium]|nr:antitoxin Xre/MbcA/ParS toxin-binding domain-containing protein [Stellaceae bacterium]
MQEHSRPADAAEAEAIRRAAALLGGPKVLRRRLGDPLQVHEMIRHGLPGAALTHLVEHVAIIRASAVLESAGMSVRTFQRHKHKAARNKPLSIEQSARTWRFAEILAKATAILGSQDEAEQWLERPAIGLDQRRPIDLLTTPAGAKLVEAQLDRMEYGVYA